MEVKVSIIIPVYNAEKYIKECLDSVFKQTFQELEVLCIDDCSTDNSIELIRQAALQDSRLILIKNEKNLGAGGTRNRGIMLAKGKYFFFLDSDDLIEADAIKKLYQRAEKDELQLCFCANVFYNEVDKSIRKIPRTTDVFLKKYQDCVFSWDDVKRFLYQNIFCVPWNRIYRTDFVRASSIRFPDLKNSEDLFFGEAIVTIADRMGTIAPEFPLIRYRLGREGQISSTIERNPYCMLESIRLLYGFLQKNHKLKDMMKSYHSMAVEMLLSSIKSVENSEWVLKYTVEVGFPEIGLSYLRCEDFTDAASYKKYCELLVGKVPYFDSYTTSVREDEKKLEEIKTFIQQNREQKTALWGMGKKGKMLLRELEKRGCRLDYYVDTDPLKAGGMLKGNKIYRYEEIAGQLDYVIITNANYFAEIHLQCKRKNLSCRVIDLETFFRCDMTIEECMA
ncbi:MAG: glycosyltransferase [Blautia sp.]|nr:glycosyltransferase [Blautia sp.]MCM1200765.1 glycosyltransferase [Bacteroides fragilis]